MVEDVSWMDRGGLWWIVVDRGGLCIDRGWIVDGSWRDCGWILDGRWMDRGWIVVDCGGIVDEEGGNFCREKLS